MAQEFVYAERAGGALVATLYRPTNATRAPLLVGVPGGGWLRGSRNQLAEWGAYLAESGIAVMAVDYRKSEAGASFPGNVQDVRDAWRYARDHADTLGVDADRIGFLGASAGAHLASLAALTTDAAARTLILAYGAYDLFAHFRAENAAGLQEGEVLTARMMGCKPTENPASYFAASPMMQIGRAAKRMRALLIWGEDDTVIHPSQSADFGAALAEAGAEVEALPIAGAGHFWFSRDRIADPAGHTHAIADAVGAFARRMLMPEGMAK